MPEKVTRQEKIISLAIEKARKAKEELSAKKRKNIEPTQVLEIDTDPEVEKIKRPKVQDASKITNQTQKKEGYGLAGESLKKQDKPIYQQPDKQEFFSLPSLGKGQQIFSLARGLENLIKKVNRRSSRMIRFYELEEMVRDVAKMQEPVDELNKVLESKMKEIADRRNK